MEAVLDMLPYMRLAHLSDPAEMETVSFAQGPVCPVSFSSSRQVACGVNAESNFFRACNASPRHYLHKMLYIWKKP
jgi:hypothetical protein